ncbi:hypothetical protein T06_2342, partial [Trichinella sp. T6]
LFLQKSASFNPNYPVVVELMAYKFGILPLLIHGIFREIRDQELPVYVCCTILIVSDRLMPINAIF